MLYADDGCISVHNSIWVQMTLSALVIMFERVVIQTNLGKNKEMVCNPGFI